LQLVIRILDALNYSGHSLPYILQASQYSMEQT
jgi:hypothetical protein